jgi:hypothetical protein
MKELRKCSETPGDERTMRPMPVKHEKRNQPRKESMAMM